VSFLSLLGELMDAGYWLYPVSVQLDERGKKKPRFEGSWTDSRRSTNVASLLPFDRGTPGLVIDTEKSGIVVIDVDEHPGNSGTAALAAAGIELPTTPMTVSTWSGGRHLFYRQPETPLSCFQNVPVNGVDLRGLGGIVFGPGTEVRDHRGEIVGAYTAVDGIVPVSELPVLSPDFVRAIDAASVRREPTASTLEPWTGDLSQHQRDTLSRWLDDDLAAIELAGDGERHGVLLSMAKKVVDRATKLGYSVEEAVGMIEKAYEASGGSEWDEKVKVAEWAIDRVAEEPLGVPSDFIDPDDVRFEEAVRERVTKLRIEREAKRRASGDNDPIDLGRELDFDEPPGGLFGKAWIEGVLPQGETVLLFGERNVGKSFVAIDLGLSVASGRPWHGRAARQGKVLYLAGEGAIGLPSRRRSWVQHHGVEAPRAFRLRDAIVHLTNPASLAAWRKVIVEDEIDLVIVDTIRRAGRGLEMESPGDAQELIALLDELRGDRHGCTVLALGHPTKSDPMQPAGAGTVQDALPMIHRLGRTGEGDAVVVDMVTTKSKDGPTGHLVSFGHRRVGESLVFVDIRTNTMVASGDPFEDNDERRRREEGW
jgi:hypothetical protein